MPCIHLESAEKLKMWCGKKEESTLPRRKIGGNLDSKGRGVGAAGKNKDLLCVMAFSLLCAVLVTKPENVDNY